MTFEELKFEIINRQRRIEFSKLLHLYIKCETYKDILQVFKSEANIEWVLQNGFYDLLQEIPIEDLEAENIFQRDISLSDQNKDIVILSGKLTIIQTGTNRCRIISDGANIDATINDSAMLEFELYQSSNANITTNQFGFAFVTTKNDSYTSITANDQSTIKVIGYGNTVTDAIIGNDAFLNSELNDSSVLNPNNDNYYARKRDESKIGNIEQYL